VLKILKEASHANGDCCVIVNLNGTFLSIEISRKN
jgi:hypothetical protein